jgi:type II secretory pathway pseudopilin PulG
MSRFLQNSSRQGRQSGYALLFAMFLVATLVILTAAASLVIRTEGQRQKEDELAWRGNQYIRAIRLYFRKNGRFPKNLEDLTKYKFGEVRYLRSAYKDPMNTADGSWRLIYMSPNGQLIGSVMKKSLGPLANLPSMKGPTGNQPGNQNPAVPQQGAQSTTDQNAQTQPPATDQQPQPAGQEQVINEGQMMGGSLVGVASKIKRPSIRVYNEGRTYFQWEFIWDPSKSGAPGVPTAPAGSTPAGNPPGIQSPGMLPPPPPPPPPIKQDP